jgi:nitroreductase
MDVLKEIKHRYSPNTMAETDISEDQLHTLIEAARLAPSCYNNQEWHYVFVHRSDETRPNLEDALSLGNGWAKKAPYLIAVGANPTMDCKTNSIPYYAFDAGLSVMSLIVQAEYQGLRVHAMAGYDEDKVRQSLGFKSNQRIVVLLAPVHEAKASSIKEKVVSKGKEFITKSKERKPASENFFLGEYGKPVS